MLTPFPIALFVCDRPEATETVLESLSRDELSADSALVVFCDGPSSPETEGAVALTRAVARAAPGFASVEVVERPEHVGHSRSVVTGVTRVLAEHDAVIVLEDGLTTSPHFLRFMNEALAAYAEEERVLSVSGYSYPRGDDAPETYFLPGSHCWGWATWRRGWALFEHDTPTLLGEIVGRDLIYELDAGGSEPLTQLLQRSLSGDVGIDSWVLSWMASAIVNDKLTLYPGRSLVRNDRLEGGLPPGLSSQPLADRAPRVGDVPTVADADAAERIRAEFIHHRGRLSPKARLFFSLSTLMPPRMERKLYSALVRRSLRRRAHEGGARGEARA